MTFLRAIALLTVVAVGAQAAWSPKLVASRKTVDQAMIPVERLTDPSNQGMQWSPQNVSDVGEALEAARKAVADLHARHPSAVADAYGNGAMTNIEETFKLFGGGELARGCLSHQQTTFDAVAPTLKGSSLIVQKVRVGPILGVFQHNAVVVFPADKDWRRSGLVLDAWLRQKSDLDRMVYTFKDWNTFGALPRLVDEDQP